MPDYRRLRNPGGTYFFTVVTHKRIPILINLDARAALRVAIEKTRTRYPFVVVAAVLLPDHLHCIWELPNGDSDFSTRWRLIKTRFTYTLGKISLCSGPPYWQNRFWEHCIRDEADLNRHIQYIHLNPVKHGLVTNPEDWRYSTYNQWLRNGYPDAARTLLRDADVDIPE
ncbi:MAG: transposase [candidate division Zixibacteria bacterium]|nr:transposase [candidate division Zixibacteria bacterium]